MVTRRYDNLAEVKRTEEENKREIEAVARILEVDSYDKVTTSLNYYDGGYFKSMNNIHVELPYNSIRDGYGLFNKKRMFTKNTIQNCFAYLKGDVLVITINDLHSSVTEVTVYNINDDTIIEHRISQRTVNVKKEMDRVIERLRHKLII